MKFSDSPCYPEDTVVASVLFFGPESGSSLFGIRQVLVIVPM